MAITISRLPRNNYQGKLKDKYRVPKFHDLPHPMKHVGEIYFVKQNCWYGYYWIIPFVKKAGLYMSDGKWRKLKNLF